MCKYLKKALLIISSIMILNFTACAKSKKSNEVQPEAEAQPVQTVVNPEIEKLNKVLLSMTDRCKAAIPNGEPEEFLADLHKVLDSAADFRRGFESFLSDR